MVESEQTHNYVRALATGMPLIIWPATAPSLRFLLLIATIAGAVG